MRIRNVAIVIPGLAFLTGCGASPDRPDADGGAGPAQRAVPIVIAHRGASGYLPEHSAEAKVLAHGLQADFIEQDVVLSRDGAPLVLHDVELDTVTDVAQRFPERRRADGRWYAIDFDLAEISALNVHERVDPRTGKRVFAQRFAPGNVRFGVRTLEEEIALLAGLNATTRRAVGLYTEIKAPAWHLAQGADITRVVLEMLERYQLRLRADPVWLQCFDPRELLRVRNDLDSDLKLVQLIGDNSWGDASVNFDQMRTPKGLATIASYADAIGVWIPHVVQWPAGGGQPTFTDLVRDAHAAGLKVHVYTLRRDQLPQGAKDFAEVHAALLQVGVDGVFSDFPDESRALLKR